MTQPDNFCYHIAIKYKQILSSHHDYYNRNVTSGTMLVCPSRCSLLFRYLIKRKQKTLKNKIRVWPLQINTADHDQDKKKQPHFSVRQPSTRLILPVRDLRRAVNPVQAITRLCETTAECCKFNTGSWHHLLHHRWVILPGWKEH